MLILKGTIYIMQLDFDGVEDEVVEIISAKGFLPIEPYMNQKGFKRIKNSNLFFQKGRGNVRYARYVGKSDTLKSESLFSNYQKTMIENN